MYLGLDSSYRDGSERNYQVNAVGFTFEYSGEDLPLYHAFSMVEP